MDNTALPGSAPAQNAPRPAPAGAALVQDASTPANTDSASMQPAQPQAPVAAAATDAQATPATTVVAAPVSAPPATAARTIAGIPARPAKTGATVQQPAHASPPSAAGSIGGTVFALALVLGLIFGLAWLARRMPGMTGLRGNSGLRVVRSLGLGARERLVVVEVGGTQLLLGTGAAGTRLLHTLETPLHDDAPVQPTPFAQLLAQRLGKKPA